MKNLDVEYKSWLIHLKSRIRSAQAKAAIAVNSALIEFYWELGKMIAETQTAYGTGFLEQVSKDLKDEFPEMQGLSVRNLKYTRQFYIFYQSLIVQQPVGQIGQQAVAQLQSSINQKGEIVQQAVTNLDKSTLNSLDIFHLSGGKLITQIPWGHNILIFTKASSLNEAHFYISETIENGWSRDILALQVKSQLFKRQGKSISNFKHTLPDPLSDLVQQTLKDPYVFDFLTMTKPFHEKDIERQLVAHITKFLLELGKGFAFIGQQYHLLVGETDYYLDLLFYHTKLKCYVVIELKNTKFIPEYAGKLNFYLSAVDSLVKQEDDKPTIGILLCRDKNNIETEFALRDINKPMGVSEFQLTEILPDELKSSLPSIEDFENEFRNIE